MRTITLKQWRYFIAAANTLSVTMAAKEMHVSQSSISMAISYIEDVTGVTLFTRRHAQGLILTKQGLVIFNKCNSMLSCVEELLSLSRNISIDTRETLKFALSSTFSGLLLPLLVKELSARLPSVEWTCDECSQKEIVQGLRLKYYDIAFSYEINLPNDIKALPLYEEMPCIVVGKDNPLAEFDEISFEMLAEHKIILWSCSVSEAYYVELFRSNGLSLNHVYRISSIGVAIDIILQGLGCIITNAPRKLFEYKKSLGLALVPLTGKNISPLRISALVYDQRSLSANAEILYEISQKYC